MIYRFTVDNVHELVSTALHMYIHIRTVHMKAPKVADASVHSLSSSIDHSYNAQQINILFRVYRAMALLSLAKCSSMGNHRDSPKETEPGMRRK